MVACLVLIAGLCFDAPSIKTETANFGLGYSATITGEHYVVQTGATDVIVMHDFRKAPRACAEGVCIRYLKTCGQADAKAVCRYSVVWPGIVPDGLFSITADGADALATAERQISIVVGRGEKSTKLPVALLTVSTTAPTECPPGLDFAACDPPE